MSDEDIDDYIDFLLAYAEDRASEDQNPLLKKEEQKVSEEKDPLPPTTTETQVEEVLSSKNESLEENLVEQEETPQQTEEDDEEALEDNTMPGLPATEELQTEIETIEEQDAEDGAENEEVVSTLDSDQPFVDEMVEEAEDIAVESASEEIAEEIVIEPAREEVEGAIVVDANFEEVEDEESAVEIVEETIFEDMKEEILEEEIVESAPEDDAEIQQDQNPIAVDKESFQADIESFAVPIETARTENDGPEDELVLDDATEHFDNGDILSNATATTGKGSLFKTFWRKAPWIGKVDDTISETDDSGNTAVTGSTEVLSDTPFDETGPSAPSKMPAFSMVDIESYMKENYESSVKYIRDFWSKPRGPVEDTTGKALDSTAVRPQRDYAKVYEKYLLPKQNGQYDRGRQEVVPERRRRSRYLIKKPWGSIFKLLKKQRSSPQTSLPTTEGQSDDATKTSTDAPEAVAIDATHECIEVEAADGLEQDSSFLNSLSSQSVIDEIGEEVESSEEPPEIETELVTTEDIIDSDGAPSFLVSLNSQQIIHEDVEESETYEEPQEPRGDISVMDETEIAISTLTDLRKELPEGLDEQIAEESDLEGVREEVAIAAIDEKNEEEDITDDHDVHAEENLLLEKIEEIIDSTGPQMVEEDSIEEEETEFSEAETDQILAGDLSEGGEESGVDDVLQEVLSEEEDYCKETADVPELLEEESTNVVFRFLIAKGLEQVVMFAILIVEFLRVYVIEPLRESAEWLLAMAQSKKLLKGNDVLSKWIKTRGGAVVDLSEDENSDLDAGDEVEEDGEDEAPVDPESADTGLSSPDEEVSADDNVDDEPVESKTNDPVSDGPDAISRSAPGPATPRIRPNRLYRFLLGYGYVGHLLIMECILVVEWLKVYMPFIPNTIDYVMFEVLRLEKPGRRGSGESAVLRTSGFLGADGTSVRAGKKKKAQTKKEDQRALDQLKRLGDVNQARYHFLSQSFMERHALGSFKSNKKDLGEFQIEEEMVFEGSPDAIEDAAAESDSEWILQALAQEEDEEELSFGSPLETDVGLSFGSGGPKVSVGVGFSIGENPRKRTKSRSLSLSSIARQSSTPVKKTKALGPRVSDRESGVMGRLRAAGASSIVGRNLLGAYPGDLPPPQEAADPSGMIYLAERYGYGDWSDDDEDEDDGLKFLDDESENDADDDGDDDVDDFSPSPKPKRNPAPKRRKKRRRKRTSSSAVEFGLGLELGGLDSPPSSSATTKARAASRSRTSTKIKPPSVSASSSRVARQPPKPMELLGDSSSKKSTDGSKSRFSAKPVRPAMSLLDDIKSKDH
ncbi:MAG: hypothetical protein SGILL_003034 [Bacillariaceae sp.]